MKPLFAVALLPLVFASCIPQELTGDTYSRHEAGQTQTVRTGTVTAVRYVKLQGGESNAGSLIGAVAGGIAGNQVGGGSGRTLATLAGAGVGALAGSATEQNMMNRQGVELTIRMSNGEILAITQEHSKRETFNVGDRVRVIYGSGRTRVSH